MKKSTPESKYVTSTVINGTVAFAAGTLVNAGLLSVTIPASGMIIRELFSSSAASFLLSSTAVVLAVVLILSALPLMVSAALAASLVLWVLRRLGSKFSHRQDKIMVIMAVVLSLIFGFGQKFFLVLSVDHALAWGTYLGILLLGLPFTVALLYATHIHSRRI